VKSRLFGMRNGRDGAVVASVYSTEIELVVCSLRNAILPSSDQHR